MKDKTRKILGGIGIGLVGALAGAGVVDQTVQPMVIEKPVPVVNEIVKTVEVPKIVEKTVTEEVEVPAKNLVINGVVYEPEDITELEEKFKEQTEELFEKKDMQDLLDEALAETEDELDEIDKCNGVDFDDDEIEIDEVFDEYTIDIDDFEDNEYKVIFGIEVDYDDDDCEASYDVTVEYDDDDVDVDFDLN